MLEVFNCTCVGQFSVGGSLGITPLPPQRVASGSRGDSEAAVLVFMSLFVAAQCGGEMEPIVKDEGFCETHESGGFNRTKETLESVRRSEGRLRTRRNLETRSLYVSWI